MVAVGCSFDHQHRHEVISSAVGGRRSRSPALFQRILIMAVAVVLVVPVLALRWVSVDFPPLRCSDEVHVATPRALGGSMDPPHREKGRLGLVAFAVAAGASGGDAEGDVVGEGDGESDGERAYRANKAARRGIVNGAVNSNDGGAMAKKDAGSASSSLNALDYEEEEEDDADDDEESSSPPLTPPEEKARRWSGRYIRWLRSWAEAKAEARRTKRPILMHIWKEKDCPACAALEKSVAQTVDVEVLSEHFVMLLLGDTETPDEPQFATLPAYAPRTYFLNYKGRLLDVVNEQGTFPDNLHYYVTGAQLVASMKDVLRDESGFDTFRAL